MVHRYYLSFMKYDLTNISNARFLYYWSKIDITDLVKAVEGYRGEEKIVHYSKIKLMCTILILSSNSAHIYIKCNHAKLTNYH